MVIFMNDKIDVTGGSKIQHTNFEKLTDEQSSEKVTSHGHSYQQLTSGLKKETGLLVKLLELFNLAVKVKQGDQVYYVRVSEAKKHVIALFGNTQLPVHKKALFEKMLTKSLENFSKVHGKGVSIEQLENQMRKFDISSIDIRKWSTAVDNQQEKVFKEFLDVITGAVAYTEPSITEVRNLLYQMMNNSPNNEVFKDICDIYASKELLDLMTAEGVKLESSVAALPQTGDKEKIKTEDEVISLLEQLKKEDGLLELTLNSLQGYAFIDDSIKAEEQPPFELGDASSKRAKKICQQFTENDIPLLRGLLYKPSKDQGPEERSAELSPEQMKYGDFKPEKGSYNRVSGILKERLKELEQLVKESEL